MPGSGVVDEQVDAAAVGEYGTDARIDGLGARHVEGAKFDSLLHNVVLLAPIVLGVFAGAPIFTREFTRGTHVFALTQSVSRRRWLAAKVIVAGVPLLAGLVALGFVTGWVDSTTDYTAHGGLGINQFATRGIIPAAHGLIAFAVAVAAGIVARTTVAALVSGLIIAGLAVAGMVLVKPDVLPPTRQITPIAATIQGSPTASPFENDPDAWYVDGGYLDAGGMSMPGVSLQSCFQPAIDAGNKAAGMTDSAAADGSTSGGGPVAMSPQQQQLQSSPEFQDAYNQALIACARGKGIASQYTDYLPGSMLWPLRWAMTAIAAILAALFLLVGAARLRTAVGKR